MHIFLIGFMGVGKSTIGRVLAERLGCAFVDSDEWIEQHAGKTVAEIFAEDGEAHFRELEKAFVIALGNEPVVVSCGGGLPCHNELMSGLKTRGHVVFLDASLEELVRRLENGKDQRPLIAGLSGRELNTVIAERLERRKPVYEQADFHIFTDGKTVDEVATELLSHVGH